MICALGCYSFTENSAYRIAISLRKQKLYLLDNTNGHIVKIYPISSSKFGIGNKFGSNKTPIGKLEVAKKIGNGAPLGTIFKCRINTGKISLIYTNRIAIDDDRVLTRIMWLKGLEKKVNDNSFERYIYIHGTPEEGLIGERASHGCIRMCNRDVIELFDAVTVGTIVDIKYEDIKEPLL
ncbi:MAG: L,D-transpeptidase [Lentisphaerae bacterium]|nr:L,D-transpeptidase [Lentisphaerota bacterium]MCP4100711.1 L,D-transpeptidase [Lentisphaerota bacterium]